MGRYTGPKHKLARREGVNVLDKTSASLQRRLNIPPGQHARKRKRRLSEFGQQLREKQKAKSVYGLMEKQFKKLFQNVERNNLGVFRKITIRDKFFVRPLFNFFNNKYVCLSIIKKFKKRFIYME